MLIDLPNQPRDPVMDAIAAATGQPPEAHIAVMTGIYRINHFGNSDWPSPRDQWDHYPEFPDVDTDEGSQHRGSYGVCDRVAQVLALYPELENSDRKFIVTFTDVRKNQQPSSGGWRWHKWGRYIGIHKPQHEYIYDEEGIDAVCVFHIYENCPPKW
jgi:hypothetical protein